MKKKPNKDLNLKIGTKKEVAWTNIKENMKQKTLQAEIELKVNAAIIALAEKEIAKEKNL